MSDGRSDDSGAMMLASAVLPEPGVAQFLDGLESHLTHCLRAGDIPGAVRTVEACRALAVDRHLGSEQLDGPVRSAVRAAVRAVDGGETLYQQLAEGSRPEAADIRQAASTATMHSDAQPVTAVAGSRIYAFGASCVCLERTRGEHRTTLLARRLRPVSVLVSEDGRTDVVVEFHDLAGHQRTTRLCVSAAASQRTAMQAAETLMKQGVQIEPGEGPALVNGLVAWSRQGVQLEYARDRPGWFDDTWSTYVNGDEAHGEFDRCRYFGPGFRSARSGDLDTWNAGVHNLVTTPVTILALGVAFAGPLVGPLGVAPVMVHIAGDSSQGKTLAAKLAASVWYRPIDLPTWDTTVSGMAITAAHHTDTVVIIDELKNGQPETIKRVVHLIADGRDRQRSNRTGTAHVGQKSWRLTAISTGENSTREFVGSGWQGGHDVRCINIDVEPGDCCRDAGHARALHALVTRNYGVAGDAWVSHLVQLGDEGFKRLRKRIERLVTSLVDEPDPELGRILNSIALFFVAIDEAQAAGVIDLVARGLEPDEPLWAVARNIADRIVQGRAEKASPCERAWKALMDMVDTRPACFPSEERFERNPPLECYGSRVSAGELKTCEAMLDATGVCQRAGCSVKRFIAWMKKTNRATADGGRRRLTVPGMPGRPRWMLISVPP